MQSDIRNIIKVACIYITTVIGAGFASGQEILKFFSTYNQGGFYGIIMAGVLFAFIGGTVLDRVYRERILNYDEFLYPAVGYFLGRIMEVIVILFMFCVFSIMIAGAGNILMETLGIPFEVGVIIMSFICMILILTDVKGIVTLSTIVTPILITGIITIGFYIIACKDTSVFNTYGYFNKLTQNWLSSTLIYVSYNSIMAIVVMTSLYPYLKSRKVGIIGGIAGGFAIGIIAFILNIAITLFYPEVLGDELPVLNIVERYSDVLKVIYAFILWLAMFVSAVTSGYFFADRMKNKVRLNVKVITIASCLLVIPLSRFGFSNLIVKIYPVFGYAGLFMVFILLLQGINAIPVWKVSKAK
ncbi:MAG: hypothetical protein N2645_17485 [Clostridia bacterium]|nr:hypothetical protein [Clostridia bacterium]